MLFSSLTLELNFKQLKSIGAIVFDLVYMSRNSSLTGYRNIELQLREESALVQTPDVKKDKQSFLVFQNIRQMATNNIIKRQVMEGEKFILTSYTSVCKNESGVEEEIKWKFKNKLPFFTKLVTRALCSEQVSRNFIRFFETHAKNVDDRLLGKGYSVSSFINTFIFRLPNMQYSFAKELILWAVEDFGCNFRKTVVHKWSKFVEPRKTNMIILAALQDALLSGLHLLFSSPYQKQETFFGQKTFCSLLRQSSKFNSNYYGSYKASAVNPNRKRTSPRNLNISLLIASKV